MTDHQPGDPRVDILAEALEPNRDLFASDDPGAVDARDRACDLLARLDAAVPQAADPDVRGRLVAEFGRVLRSQPPPIPGAPGLGTPIETVVRDLADAALAVLDTPGRGGGDEQRRRTEMWTRRNSDTGQFSHADGENRPGHGQRSGAVTRRSAPASPAGDPGEATSGG